MAQWQQARPQKSPPSPRYLTLADRAVGSHAMIGNLTGRSRQAVERLLSKLASGQAEHCSLDDLASQLATTPTRLRLALRRAIDAGLIEIGAEASPVVSPTIKLLRACYPNLCAREA